MLAITRCAEGGRVPSNCYLRRGSIGFVSLRQVFGLKNMAIAFLTAAPPALARRPLTERDAVDIWIARWLRIRQSDLVRRYGCDPRRLYEIWGEEKFLGSRAKALAEFEARFPTLTDRIDAGRHAKVTRANHPDQLPLFP
jgi:hypothetical protein